MDILLILMLFKIAFPAGFFDTLRMTPPSRVQVALV
jgi:hypothetical protein